MATYYVDNTAAGAADGTSWTDAWTSITSVAGLSAGDTVLFDHSHTESGATRIWAGGTGSLDNPIRLITVARGTGLN